MLDKILKIIFIGMLAAYLPTLFIKNDYRRVDSIVPEALGQPAQSKIEAASPFQFSDGDYRYTAHPLYNYEIAAMIVHRMDYRRFSIHKTDSVFPMDLCLMWGDSLKKKSYQNKSLKFSQDFRFCLYRWQGERPFNLSEVSNNHLLIKDDGLKRMLKGLSSGDQIKITGQLVNVEAEKLSAGDPYNPEKIRWNSSLGRDDQGAGACEVILVEDLRILQKSNPASYLVNKISKFGLLGIGSVLLILFFATPLNRYYSRG